MVNPLPYESIPEYPDEIRAVTVMARLVDGLGFRFYCHLLIPKLFLLFCNPSHVGEHDYARYRRPVPVKGKH